MNTQPPPRSALYAREGDTGLQHERTSLAWARTAMAFAVIGGLLLRSARQMLVPVVGYALGFAVLGVGALLLLRYQEHYLRREPLLYKGDGVAHPASLRVLAIATTLTCVAAMVGVGLQLA